MKLDNRRNLTTKLAYIAGFIDGEEQLTAEEKLTMHDRISAMKREVIDA